jgi:hypothetical protein
MTKLIQALGLSLILLTGSVGFAKKREKKELPSVIQIAPLAYELGANEILNPLKPAYENYLKSHPDLEALKNQQAIKANEYHRKEDEIEAQKNQCDTFASPANPAKTKCLGELQILKGQLETINKQWSNLRQASQQKMNALRFVLNPPLLKIVQLHLGILLQFALDNYVYILPEKDINSSIYISSRDEFRKDYTLYAISMDYYPARNVAQLKLTLQHRDESSLYSFFINIQTPKTLHDVENDLYTRTQTNGLLVISDPDVRFTQLRNAIFNDRRGN